jgi:hypothetical protein
MLFHVSVGFPCVRMLFHAIDARRTPRTLRRDRRHRRRRNGRSVSRARLAAKSRCRRESSARLGPAVLPAPASRSRWLIAAALFALAASGVVAGHFLWQARVAQLPEYHQLTFDRGRIWSARFTPDGQSVVYGAVWRASPLQLYSVHLGGRESRALALAGNDILSISSLPDRNAISPS